MESLKQMENLSGPTLHPLFPHYSTQLSKSPPKIVREDLVDPKKNTCYLLHNVLSKEECKAIIAASEQHGYEKAENYCFMYRDRYNDRVMTEDPLLSDFIWNRVKEFVPENPFSAWHSKGLNSRWRYCRYFPGHFFGAHTDGMYSANRLECSFLTFMLYLNSPHDGDFKGGNTTFLKPTKKPYEVNFEVTPQAGTAIIFTQEEMQLLHRGDKVLEGTKYILRSDILFECNLEELEAMSAAPK